MSKATTAKLEDAKKAFVTFLEQARRAAGGGGVALARCGNEAAHAREAPWRHLALGRIRARGLRTCRRPARVGSARRCATPPHSRARAHAAARPRQAEFQSGHSTVREEIIKRHMTGPAFTAFNKFVKTFGAGCKARRCATRTAAVAWWRAACGRAARGCAHPAPSRRALRRRARAMHARRLRRRARATGGSDARAASERGCGACAPHPQAHKRQLSPAEQGALKGPEKTKKSAPVFVSVTITRDAQAARLAAKAAAAPKRE